ncbi:MAG TPA: tetratricopeptide repeat protein [Pyrinomonadaceae bacterium]
MPQYSDPADRRPDKALFSLFMLVTLLLSYTLTTPGQSNSRAKQRSRKNLQASAAFEKTVKSGEEARIAGRLDEAIAAYQNALGIRPRWPDGWWYLGALFYQKDLYPKARDAFRKLVLLEPKRGPAWAMLGLCEFQTREYHLAASSLERGSALGLNGNRELTSVVIYHTALLYALAEQFEIAYDVLRRYDGGYENQKIVEAFGLVMLRMPVDPRDISADKREAISLAGRAGASMAAHRTDDGRRAFEELLTRYPNDPNAHYSFGVFMIPQDADRALQEFRRALELNPHHQASMVQMAFEYLKRREYDKALPLAEKSVELAPGMYPARNALGRVLLELGQTARAIVHLEEGIRLAPGSPEMHFALARAYTRAGRKQEADREQEIFQKLRQKYNEQGSADQTGNASGINKTKPKP